MPALFLSIQLAGAAAKHIPAMRIDYYKDEPYGCDGKAKYFRGRF